MTSITPSSVAPSSGDFILELLDTGRTKVLGWGSDMNEAFAALDEAENDPKYTHFGVRLRLGQEVLGYRLARPFVADGSSRVQ